MSADVIAFPRRSGVYLAAVAPDSGGAELLELVAEDGARFRFPAERAICRVSGVGGPTDDEDVAQWLTRVRTGLEPFGGWCRLHGELDEGARLTTEEIAAREGFAGALGVLRVALGAAGADPWFRQKGSTFTVVPARRALEGLYRRNEERFRAAGDDAVADWWPRRERVGVPRAWRREPVAQAARATEERSRWMLEERYEPEADTAACAALDALRAFATWRGGPEAERGAALSRRLTIGEEPERLLEALVGCGALPDDIDPTAARAGLAEPLDAEAQAEARRITAEPVDPAGRVDLTGLHTVAVDSADTREVDDAFSLRVDGDTVELLVHVTDVAAAIPARGPLDRAARERACSLFSPDGAVLMLPPELVVERLALTTDGPRPAVTGVFRIGRDGGIEDARFERTLVRLDRRVTYEEALEPTALVGEPGHAEILLRTARAMLAHRESRGARVLRLPELYVDARGERPQIGMRELRGPGDVVVMECMVAYSSRAGRVLSDAGVAAVFRCQGEPRRALSDLPSADDPLYAPLVRRSFAPVSVGAEPAPHHGVGAVAYAQATSPIRRYSDLVNQRQLAAAIAGESPPYTAVEIEELAPTLLHREREVRQAAAARDLFWVARSLEERGVRELEGVLFKAPRRGLGTVYVPSLCREVHLRPPKSWEAPPVGTVATWPVHLVSPWRGRIELAPPPEATGEGRTEVEPCDGAS